MSDLVLVTGGDGFLGSHVVRELVMSGYRVRVFVEPGRPEPTAPVSGVEVYRGDIRRFADVERAVPGCDYVVHAAACTDLWPSRSDKLVSINVDGTRHVIDAVLSTGGVKRMVHVGTANSFGPGTRELPGTEERSYTGHRSGLGYIETKRRAQTLVQDAVSSRGLPAVIAAPTFMIGPGDTKPGSGALLIAIVDRQIPGYARGGRNYACVGDVARGIVSALSNGRTGESYIMGNANLHYREFYDLVGSVWGVKPPSVALPAFAILAGGSIASFIAFFTRRAPRVTRQIARISLETCFYSSEKAVRELGYPQTPIDAAVREALEWFSEHGYLSANQARVAE